MEPSFFTAQGALRHQPGEGNQRSRKSLNTIEVSQRILDRVNRRLERSSLRMAQSARLLSRARPRISTLP